MAVVQGLTHFVTICMADTLRRMNTDIRATEAYMSPVYQIELGLVGRLLSQDPALYADILEQNPFVPEVLAACRSAVGDLEAIVKTGDPEAFAEFFGRDTRHLGEYCKRGQDLTDALIECMVKK
jgi:prephenate dehydrogenase